MEKINKLLNFIEENKNWKDLIQKEPYNITIREDTDYILLKYNQLESDFNSDIVCACRGIILNKENQIVCFPFYKFFNYGEPQASNINWNTAKVQEKIDGSLIKVWYDNLWRISTNGTINDYNAPVNETNKTFEDLFKEAIPINFYEKLDKNNTYMFELVSPENQIVVNYSTTKIYHIGTRNNKTYKEIDVDIGIEKPKIYEIDSLEKAIKSVQNMSKNEEGYVITDKNYNRIKVKSPAYLMAHYLFGNAKFTNKRIIEIIKAGEENEILNYFPEFKNV